MTAAVGVAKTRQPQPPLPSGCAERDKRRGHDCERQQVRADQQARGGEQTRRHCVPAATVERLDCGAGPQCAGRHVAHRPQRLVEDDRAGDENQRGDSARQPACGALAQSIRPPHEQHGKQRHHKERTAAPDEQRGCHHQRQPRRIGRHHRVRLRSDPVSKRDLQLIGLGERHRGGERNRLRQGAGRPVVGLIDVAIRVCAADAK